MHKLVLEVEDWTDRKLRVYFDIILKLVEMEGAAMGPAILKAEMHTGSEVVVLTPKLLDTHEAPPADETGC